MDIRIAKGNDGGLEWLARSIRSHIRIRLLFHEPSNQIVMPNTNSAKKRLRQNKKRRLHNKAIKSSLKTQLRKVHEAVAGDDADARDGAFQAAVSSLDRAAAKKIIHRNAAARLKSRLSAKVKAAKA